MIFGVTLASSTSLIINLFHKSGIIFHKSGIITQIIPHSNDIMDKSKFIEVKIIVLLKKCDKIFLPHHTIKLCSNNTNSALLYRP